MSLSVVLLTGAGLLVRSLSRLQAVDVGFDQHDLLIARINLPPSRYSEPSRIREFFGRLTEEIEALPGVVAVGGAETLPLAGAATQTPLSIDGRPLPALGERDVIAFDTVTPGYFQVMGIPLLRGRTFTGADDATAPIRIVVSRGFARRFFPGQDPIHGRILLGRSPTAYEIIGEVGDVRHESLDSSPVEFFYLCANQRTVSSLSLIVRTSGPPLGLSQAVRGRVSVLDKDQPIARLETMDDVVAASVAGRRFILLVLGLFAGVAVALAAVGIYSVMAYTVSRRTAEIGIRLALGARRQSVFGLVVRRSLVLTLLGVGIGMAAALAVTRSLSGQLYGVSATDPVTFFGIALISTLVSLLASCGPAYRASRLDPVTALRCA